MLSRVLSFFAKRGKQLAGSDKAGNTYYRQFNDIDGTGNFNITLSIHSHVTSMDPLSREDSYWSVFCGADPVKERRWVEFGGSSVVELIPGKELFSSCISD